MRVRGVGVVVLYFVLMIGRGGSGWCGGSSSIGEVLYAWACVRE